MNSWLIKYAYFHEWKQGRLEVNMYVKEKENMHISCTWWDIFRARMKCAVVCTNVMAQKEPDASLPPHHLWPPAEPWRGCCLQRSGPGRYSNRRLPAARMKWWGRRWATPRSDCWAAAVGWERADSVERGTNVRLGRTLNQLHLETGQNTQRRHRTRVCRSVIGTE